MSLTDNQLIGLLATQMEAAVASGGWNLIVEQKDQPTQQGIPTAGAVFFQKLHDHAYGSPKIRKVSNYDPSVPGSPKTFTEYEDQWYETTFQISALVTQDPTNLSLPTASDVANYVKMYLASRATRSVLMQQNVGMLRVTQIRDPAFQDDRERFEYHPNFDITLTYERTIEIVIPGTNDVRQDFIIGV